MSEQVIVKDQRLDHWYKVDNALILQYGAIIGPYGIAIYNVLALHANHDTHEAYPSYQTIAELSGCSRRKVIQTLEVLESHNIVRGEGRMKNDGSPNSNVWVLVDKSLWGAGNKNDRLLREVVQDMHYPSESDALPVVNGMHQGSASPAPKQESMNKTNITRERNPIPKKQPKRPAKGSLSDADKERLNAVSELLCNWCFNFGLEDADGDTRGKIKSAVLRMETLRPVGIGDIRAMRDNWRLPNPPWPSQLFAHYARLKPKNTLPQRKIRPETQAALAAMGG